MEPTQLRATVDRFDGFARTAVDESGGPVPGLCTARNTTASGMARTYPGPGSSIGPAVVFGYRAARHTAEQHRMIGAGQ